VGCVAGLPGLLAVADEDLVDGDAAVTYIVTRDRRVAVNEILIRNGEQTW
jgi:hypothetical protein